MRKAYIGLAFVVLFWGGNFTASKIALQQIHPLAFTAVRYAAAAAIVAFLLYRKNGTLKLQREHVAPMIWLGLIGNSAYQLLFINGLARTSATNSALILASMPTVVAIAAGLLGMETVTGRRIAGLAVATAGVVAVIAARGFEFGGDHLGDVLMLAGVFCWAAYTIGLRRFGNRLPAFDVTAWTLLTGTPVLVLAGLPFMRGVDWPAVSAVSWFGLAYSTVLSLVVAYVLWSRAVQQVGPGRASLVSLMVPFVATTIAMLVLHERPGLVHLAGGALIVTGVLLAQSATRAVRVPRPSEREA